MKLQYDITIRILTLIQSRYRTFLSSLRSLIYILFFFGYTPWHVVSQLPNYGLNLYPLQCKSGVLTTGLLGKSLCYPFIAIHSSLLPQLLIPGNYNLFLISIIFLFRKCYVNKQVIWYIILGFFFLLSIILQRFIQVIS